MWTYNDGPWLNYGKPAETCNYNSFIQHFIIKLLGPLLNLITAQSVLQDSVMFTLYLNWGRIHIFGR